MHADYIGWETHDCQIKIGVPSSDGHLHIEDFL
jgi:hypothetical protein